RAAIDSVRPTRRLRLPVTRPSCASARRYARRECPRARQKRKLEASTRKRRPQAVRSAGNRAISMTTPANSGGPSDGPRPIPKTVLLGVTGGVAAYKSPDLVRRLTERGCTVQVVLSHGASRFVTPVTFQAVSGRRVRDELWDEDAEAAMGHIELARWADVVLVAPATAHFIGSLAAGLAGDLLTTLCLAT